MRFAFRALLALVALIFIAALALLGPPHWQIRRVEPALPTAVQLRTLLAEEAGPAAVAYVEMVRQERENGVFGHSAVIAEWPDGRAFLVDAGMDRETTREFDELVAPLTGGRTSTYVGSISERLGTALGRVAGVGLTHLHIDHSQGLVEFCAKRGAGARIYQSEAQATLHNLHTKEGAAIVADSCLERVSLGGAGLLRVSGFPGMALVPLGGHTPGSTLFAFAVAGHLWLLSGDITNAKPDLLENRGKGFLYSFIAVPEDTQRTRLLREWLAELDREDDMTVVVSHDLGVTETSGLPHFGG